jgi:tetratricopeptide (TPR) repeat protein
VRLGGQAFNRGELELAKRLHTENLTIRRDLQHRRGIAVALANLGSVALRLGDLDRAYNLFEEGLRMFAEDRDTQGMAPTTLGLGEIACQQGDFPRATSLMHHALGLAHSIGATGQVCLCLEALRCWRCASACPNAQHDCWAQAKSCAQRSASHCPPTNGVSWSAGRGLPSRPGGDCNAPLPVAGELR